MSQFFVQTQGGGGGGITQVLGVGDITVNTVGTVATVSTVFSSTTTHLTSTQMNNLFTTPVTLVPAPGVGNIIVFYSALFVYDFNTTPYNIGASGDLDIEYNSDPNYTVTDSGINPTFLALNSDQTYIAYGTITGPNNTAATSMVNRPLTLNISGGNLSAGDSPVTAIVVYRIQATGL